MVLTLSFSNPGIGEDVLNLETFDLNFSVEKFYAPYLAKAKQYSVQREQILNGKKEADFGDKYIDPWSFESIVIDSVFKDDNSSKKLIGLQYNMKSWTEGDSIAQYGPMTFEALNMMRDTDGKFMALVATNQSQDEDPFKLLLAEIEKKYGKAKIIEDEFFGGYYVYRWQLPDRLLAISSKYNDKSNELKLSVNLDSMKLDTTKKPSIDSKLFIVSNRFRDSLAGNLKSGAWLYFDKISGIN